MAERVVVGFLVADLDLGGILAETEGLYVSRWGRDRRFRADGYVSIPVSV